MNLLRLGLKNIKTVSYFGTKTGKNIEGPATDVLAEKHKPKKPANSRQKLESDSCIFLHTYNHTVYIQYIQYTFN